MSLDGITRIKGPELDDMFVDGMKGLIGGSLLMGTGAEASQMLGPGFGPLVGTAVQLQAGMDVMRAANQMTQPRIAERVPAAPGPSIT
ncbi:MAG: hypothetical protein HY370_04565 [Proteobacteria bacterium]|nr:hypothetical protein [Pseudomonadota bacterium]